MKAIVQQAVERTISRATGGNATIVSHAALGSGCISQALRVVLSDGRQYFLKLNTNAPHEMFQREADGLKALRSTGTIDVPDVIGVRSIGDTSFLVLQAITLGDRPRHFFRQFGVQLAQLHRCATREQFGFDADNFLGNTNQPNQWQSSWPNFWRQHRLGFQLKLARKNGYGDSQFHALGEKLCDRLDELLATDEPPSLLHGDLWSGNYLSDRTGRCVLIDPAVYYGHREAEFGMTTLFGGCDPSFYDAYEETWPLAPGSKPRIEIYRLYHLLNHLNLFGQSYYDACLEILRRYGSSTGQ